MTCDEHRRDAMKDVTAIILAAGMSQRMGARNKLLLPVNGVPMIRHMVAIYRAISMRPVLVVTGHDAQAVAAALDGSGAHIVHNPDFAAGQPTSVDAGLRAVPLDHDVIIGLGDQPLLTPDDLRALRIAHEASGAGHISIPQHDGQRGNPIVIPAGLCKRILYEPALGGCRRFTETHPEHVQFHALPSPGFYTDVDTPDAYAAILPAGRLMIEDKPTRPSSASSDSLQS